MSPRAPFVVAGLLLVAAVSVQCTKSAATAESQTTASSGAGAGEKIAPPPGDMATSKGIERIPAPPGGTPSGGPGGPGAPAIAGGPDSSFKVAVEVPAGVAAGAEAVAKVTVTPGEGYKVNEEYPSRLTLEAPTGVTLAKLVLEKEDAQALDKHQLAFAVKLTPGQAGSYKINGSLKFAVCTTSTCDPKKQAIAIDVVAK
jgi:hypothetical protein